MGLEGATIWLREQRAEDMPLLQSLRNDMRTQGYNKALPPDYTEPMLRGRFEERRFSLDRDDAVFIIERKADGRALGFIAYGNLEPRHNTMVGMGMDQEVWGSGAAREALDLLLGFLFLELGLRVVHMWTISENVRAVKLAEKLGFVISSRKRESCYKGGKLGDTLLMDVLREEYLDPRGLTDTLPKLEDAPGSMRNPPL